MFVDSLGNVPRKSYKDILNKIEEKYYHREAFEPYDEMKLFDFWRLYYTAFSRAQDLLVLTCNEDKKTPSKYIKEVYGELQSVEALDLSEFIFHTVKSVNLKNTFSFTSHIAVYETCALQYKFYKELEFMPIRQGAMLFGTLVHETIEDVHRAALRNETEKITKDNITSLFDSNYISLIKTEHGYLAEAQRNEENFETRFARFLNKLLMELMTKYLMILTINAVKPDILKLNSAIVASDIPTFEFKTVDMTQLEPYIQNPNRNAVRMLLKTLAYEHQDDLLPAKWEIEHIFPQKWQTNYFPDEPDATIKERIEHIGNKLPFEKKLNIVAGNGYFGKKKKEYTSSKIVITKAMGTSDVMDWNLESITKRDIRVSDEVIEIMKRWDNEYLDVPASEGKAEEPSEEELAQIEKFKKNGWI